MKYTNVSNNPRVEINSVCKSGTGLSINYSIDGIDNIVTGDFYIDRHDVLHHLAADPKNEEEDVELLIKLEFWMAHDPNYGGKRLGAGRKATIEGKTIAKTFRLSDQAVEYLKAVKDKSAYVNNLIIQANAN